MSRLRAPALTEPMHVVLVEPEIPPNTGNVARLCAATGSPLHLVGKLGFRIDEHAVRRAGLDYWHLVRLTHHLDWEHFLHAFCKDSPHGTLYLFAAGASQSYLTPRYKGGDALVFGKESVGLSPDLLARYPESQIAIPTLGAVRSHNLANAVSIGLYEALRQRGALDETFLGS